MRPQIIDRRSPQRALRGFTLAEVMVALAASSIVLCALVVIVAGASRALSATETYSRAQAAQIRLIDAVGQDLRRATGIAVTTNPNTVTPADRFAYSPTGINAKTIQDGTYDLANDRVGGANNPSVYLTFTLPGFYVAHNPAASGYRTVNTLISTGRAVRYGGSTAVATDVTVQYRKAYMGGHASECYLRREAGIDRIIVERADDIDLDIVAQKDGSFVVDAWFTPTFSNSRRKSNARVTSSDRIMLRNPRRD